ncbi:MAG: LD-carboxypeptidase [Muribaculaceae bacterium]|nr:LD-carboxypeptidase [Muribaculaceae bacterium]
MNSKMMAVVAAMLLPVMAMAEKNKGEEMIMPEFLQPGDTIAIISPASLPKADDVDGACRVLREWGYMPVLGEHVLTEHGSFAGNIEQRKQDVEWAFVSPNIKAVMCSRGGYGSIQVLLELRKGFFRDYPKWLIGYSDISAMHAAMVANGVMSIHGNMCGPLCTENGNDPRSQMLKRLLAGELPRYEVAPDSLNRCGEVTGRLIGGNMAVLTDVACSEFDVLQSETDYILFLEDVDEGLEALNRMIYRMKAAGVLDRVKGLIVGKFNNAPANKDFKHINDVFHSVVKDYDFPVCYDFPTGHVEENYPLIEGAMVTLKIAPEGVTLEYVK